MLACGVSMKEIQEWLGHSAISTTADIYSHLNFSSKLNVANTLTNVLGGEMIESSGQDQEETKALLSTLFRGAEHEQAKVDYEPVEAIENDFVAEELVEPDGLSYDKDLGAGDKAIAEFRKVKEKMARLGFTDYDEYLDYLEYMERKAARKKDLEM